MNPTTSSKQSRILLVDDEPAVLNSLKRTMRSDKYEIFTAADGESGLALLAEEKVHLVISDMQMPGMNGAEFLQKVAASSPETIRIILTGHADLAATVHAINEGKIYAYLTKPWENDKLIQLVDIALYTQHLEQEKQELVGLVRDQNKQLKELNQSLASKVQHRTRQLQIANAGIEEAHHTLRSNYDLAMEVFCRLMEHKDSKHAGHCKRVAQLAKKIAIEMALDQSKIDNIYYAGLLHDIGKADWPVEMLSKSAAEFSLQEKRLNSDHVLFGQALMMPLDSYHEISHFIRHHHERYNGKGFPDKLVADAIPIEAAILAVAEDFDEASCGLLFADLMSYQEAKAMIVDGSGEAYCPAVVAAFEVAVDELAEIEGRDFTKLTSGQLNSGMVLAKDLLNADGALLLTVNSVLSDSHIDRIKYLEVKQAVQLVIWVNDA